MNTWTIYMYQFPNGKRYIGKTVRTLSKRQGGSKFPGYEKCTLVYRAMQKYGFNNVKQKILFKGQMKDEEATRLEQMCILLFQTNVYRFNDPQHGYNLTDGGQGQKGRKLVGSELERSLRQLRECAERRRGTHPSQETRRKQSLAKKGKKTGPMSEQTKRKISVSNSHPNPKKGLASRKPVRAVNPITGEILTFVSGEAAAKHFGVRSSAVTRWINGTRKPTNGYKFEYIESGNND